MVSLANQPLGMQTVQGTSQRIVVRDPARLLYLHAAPRSTVVQEEDADAARGRLPDVYRPLAQDCPAVG